MLLLTGSLAALYAIEDTPTTGRLPAFPTAEGYGMFASGGRGGEVYEVTSLEDSGPGSLRDGVSKPNRTIVFRISGTIELARPLLLSEPNITIAGQTAPGGGICLKNSALLVNARNIIIRYLRVRPGDQGTDNQVDGISMGPRGGADLIFDHCSVSWAVDENFSVYGLPNVTVQWCLISEALANSKHPKGVHSMGGILNGYDMSVHHNLFASNNDRNPKFDAADWWPGKNTDFRNNIIYNWGARATWGGNGGNTITNVVNNYYKAGPDSHSRRAFLTLAGGSPGEWFVDGNIVEGAPDISQDNWSGVVNTGQSTILNAIRIGKPASSAPIETETALVAYQAVLDHVGANFPARDSVDQRIVGEVNAGTGRIIDSPSQVGGWPVLPSAPAPADSDHDGMPDDWEVAHGLDPEDAADRNSLGSGGFTHLEIYLNSLVSPRGPVVAKLTPSPAFWPRPKDGAGQVDPFPVLRWKAGFGTSHEQVYFGLHPRLGAEDLKSENPRQLKYTDKQEISSSRFSPGALESGRTYYWRVDEVNEAGKTIGDTWSFTPGTPAKGPNGTRMEAEEMTLENAVIETIPAASGGKLVSVPTGNGTMRFVFEGAPGTYRLTLHHLDEGDGAGSISLQINANEVASWIANADNDQFVGHNLPVVSLARGDLIKITSHRDRGELGRIDFIDFAILVRSTK